MELKKEIELILESLKNAGYDRGRIEEELGYSDNYIDQVLSKGGNKRFLRAIASFEGRILQKATPIKGSPFSVEEPSVLYNTLPLGGLNITLKDYFELLKESAIKAEEREKEYLEIIKTKLISIDANSKEIADDISALTDEIQAEHRAIMDSIDKAAKQPIGTTAAAADTVELASRQGRVGKGRKVTGNSHT